MKLHPSISSWLLVLLCFHWLVVYFIGVSLWVIPYHLLLFFFHSLWRWRYKLTYPMVHSLVWFRQMPLFDFFLIVLGWMSWTFYYNIQVTVIVFCCCWQPDIDIFWLVHLGCLFCIRISFISFVFWNSFYFSCRLGCVCLACCVAVGVLGLGKSKSFIFDSVPLFLPFCCTQGFLCFPVLFLCCC